MADQEPLETTSQDAEQLPERIRVHALAKLLGVTSKRILAKLTEMGADARSAQSNVDRAVAESVRDALAPVEADAAAEQEQSSAQPPTAEPADKGTAQAAATAPAAAEPPEPAPQPQTGTPFAAAGVIFSAPEAVSPGQPPSVGAAHQPTTQLFTHVVRQEPEPATPPVFESAAVVQAPLFLSPDAAAAEQARRQRRSERETRRTEETTPEPAEDETEVAEDETEVAEDERESSDQQGDAEGQPRRRRRGRRGRGRGRGEQQSEADEGEETESETEDESTPETGEAAEPAEATTDDAEDDDGVPEGSSRRRRRRRRRKVAGESGESESADDDPPNTVVHEREPRNKTRSRATVDEVQGITGSTRLEAKRQRRRDGREAGRRRPPILTESEFLARREAVDRVMVVREKSFPDHPTATQVAVLEDNVLVEHFVTSTGSASMVGNVYLGKVQNVLPSMEAAFVDIGRGRNGVLYAGEVNWEAAGLGGKERKIEQALKPGAQVLVQVSKDPVGHKGARLTTQISLAGRFLVYVPGGTSTGISRKLPDTERKRLKEILREIVPADAGVIIRTASEGVSETELARDVERLQATWRTIQEQTGKDNNAPKSLYEEPDLLVKVIRDLFNEDFSKLVIEGDRAWSTVEKYIGTVAPDLLARVARHENSGVDVFEAHRIDEQLAKALDRKVWLPSGGTLVIDRTEAMTVIDVNTGKFTGSGGSNLEETVTRNNLEAAEEIVRQMRLRDIGGMIVVDFIDMVLESNRDLVLRRLTEALGRDRTRHQVSEVTSLGLVQMTRKKLGTGLVEAFSTTCEHCHGRGILVHAYPVEPGSGEEAAGRTRESGSRRRRGRDKGAAAQAQPSNGSGPAADHAEEGPAVKRAHPAALAMAAHQPEDDQEATQAGDKAAAASAVAETRAETAEAVEPAVADEFAAAVEDGAAAESLSAATVHAAVAVPAEEPETEPAEVVEVVEQAEPVAAVDAVEPEPARAAEAAPAAEPAQAAAPARGAEPVGAAEAVQAETAQAAEPARVAEPAQAPQPAHAAEPARTAEPALATEPVQAVESASAVESGAPATTNGVAESGQDRPARRRRVARSAAAPAADSSGAVFVLPTAEQAPAPTIDYSESAPVELPQRSRPRRRAVGRPAGAPDA
ncbi:translation initiation factor IF-2 N-terminal domain-containing protein [Nocardia sp. NBC_00508]|uniref:translation initiation factor IF-2 N-terminal domain-containing protein n=1 Tax=Nocardia sp. NBC_00508 TaxID=2975992 RepID=UPI002E823F39|nr:translation initiation factor IF-2 N-terminal domain-containing protein [Nocardia sp. NBC_00508]WUD68065.1 translation initiation factor IF-2 N-terminal domain-containing protein [Nocardia sp. NBC_00508]